MKITLFILLIAIFGIQGVMNIELELNSNNSMEACTVLLSSFDVSLEIMKPVNVELKFPPVPNKQAHETFGIRLSMSTDTFHQTYL